MKFTIFGLLAFAGLALATGVDAAPRRTANNVVRRPVAPVIVLTPSEKAAKAILDKMVATLNNSEGIRYTAAVSYATGEPGSVVTKQTTVDATLERFAKMSIKASTGEQLQGVINASGKALTIYDAVSGRYITVTTSPDLGSALNALEIAGKAIFPAPTPVESALYVSFAFPDLYFAGRFYDEQIGAGVTVHFTMTSSTVNGKPVNVVAESISRGTITRSMIYSIDPTTNTPVEFEQSQSVNGQPAVAILKVDYSNFKSINTPLPVSTYSYSVPATAVLVNESGAPAAPSIPSASSTSNQ